jgi:hypothetical protein
MNMPSTPFSPQILHQAREQALLSKRKFIIVLEEIASLEQSAFMDWLGQIAGYATANMTELHSWQADFEALTFGDCCRPLCR